MSNIYYTFYKSEIGILKIAGTDEGILSISFIDDNSQYNENVTGQQDISGCLKECTRQLDEYFKGKRKQFNLNLIIEGTVFQRKVWESIQAVHFGETASYADIAAALGNSKACRAVGNANNKNRIPIIIPCHRIIGANGKLIGYAGGLWRKQWLLSHEKK